MKIPIFKFKMIFIVALLQLTLNSAQAGREGNGGDFIYCEANEGHWESGYQTLDYQLMYQAEPGNPISPVESWEQSFQRIYLKLKQVAPKWASDFKLFYKSIGNFTKKGEYRWENAILQDLKDENIHKGVHKSCLSDPDDPRSYDIVQAVRRYDERGYIRFETAWEDLEDFKEESPPLQYSMLMFHEFGHSYFPKDVRGLRRFNYFVHSEAFDQLEKHLDFQNALKIRRSRPVRISKAVTEEDYRKFFKQIDLGNIETIRSFLNYENFDVNYIGEGGNGTETFLMRAAQKNKIEVLKLLIQRGAHLNTKGYVVWDYDLREYKAGTAFDIAVANGYRTAARILARTALKNQCTDKNFEKALYAKDLLFVSDCLKKGRVSIAEKTEMLKKSFRLGEFSIAKRIFQEKGIIKKIKANLKDLIYEIARNYRGHTEERIRALKFIFGKISLIEKMKLINDVPSKKWSDSLLMETAKIEIFKFLLQEGVKVNVKDTKGETALTTVLKSQSSRSEKRALALLKYKGDIKVHKKIDGLFPPLLVASASGRNSLIGPLINRGAKINEREGHERGYTALIMAAQNGHLSTVKTLIAHGANVFQKSKKGKTALQVAKGKGHTEIVEFLKGIIKKKVKKKKIKRKIKKRR